MSYSFSCYYHLHRPSSNKIQHGDILVPAYPSCPRKCLLKQCPIKHISVFFDGCSMVLSYFHPPADHCHGVLASEG